MSAEAPGARALGLDGGGGGGAPGGPGDGADSGLGDSMKRSTWALFAGVFAACVALTLVTGYELHDPDSRLYAGLSADLAARPVADWVAPEWGGRWSRDGLFREHPPGMLWLGAALARLGLGGFGAVYTVNFICLFLELLLLFRLGRRLGGPLVGAAAIFAWAANPTFIQYLVRGNHEHPLALAVVLTLYALAGTRTGRARLLAWIVALGLAVWVKGVSGLALLPIAGAYWLVYERRARLFAEVALGALVVLATLLVFELAYRAHTGESFWQVYLERQVRFSLGAGSGEAALASGTAGPLVTLAHKARNVAYYLARPLWFFFPWVFFVAYALVQRLRHRRVAGETTTLAFGLGLIPAVVFLFGFSLADRKADRYVMPCYPGLALAFGWWLVHGDPPRLVRALGAWLERRWRALPYALSLGLLVGVGVKIFVGTYYYWDIRFWSGAFDHLAP